MKTCTKCGDVKDYIEYYTDKRNTDNLHSWCKACVRERRMLNYNKNIEKEKKYYQENKESILNRNKIWTVNNLERRREITNKAEKRNRGKHLIYRKLRMEKFPSVKIASNLRCRIYNAIKNGSSIKAYSFIALCGCDRDFLVNHLEKQFKEGMTWDNYGVKGWHIDHKRPCASFALTEPKQQKQCFHYTNLQPLWAEDNLSKGSKLDWRYSTVK